MRKFTVFGFLLITCLLSLGQTPSYNFRRVTGKDGLSDGVVSAIAQDKYGYLWFGTLSGLNRYDGYKITNFIFNPRDSFSVPPDFIRTLLCDREGELWCGYSTGLYRFDYKTLHFVRVAATKGISINEIKQGIGKELCILTNQGLATYKTDRHIFSFERSVNRQSLLANPMFEGCVYRDAAYIAGDSGIIIHNFITKETRLLGLNRGSTIPARRVAVDSNGTIWASRYEAGAFLYKGIINNTSFEEINFLRYSSNGAFENIMDLYVDAHNHLLLATVWRGLLAFNGSGNTYTSIVNDPRMQNSIPENHLTKIFVGKQGFMWLGTEGSGVTYFQPDYNLFKVFFPAPIKMVRPHIWSRAIAEDQEGNLWMGTGSGLVRENRTTAKSTLYHRDEITGIQAVQNNSIRSLLCDQQNDIWIGTASGMNKYESKTGKMLSFDEKDSLPKDFYWALLQDTKKTIWIGSNRGLHYKLPGDNRFYSLFQHPVLRPFARYGVRSLLEDSHQNLWIGLNGGGLLLFDTKKQSARYWNELGTEGSSQGRIITSIAEDKKGILWFSSYYGIAAYDFGTGKFTSYSDIHAMESLQISGLQVDAEDRLWLASPKGLLMLDKDRKIFKRFSVEDGLPDIEFNDQISYRLKDGQFVYPSYDGFVAFNPLQYKEKNSSNNVLISDFNVPGNSLKLTGDIREQKELKLSPGQNFFNIELTAFNYANPKETWYAYQLENFDKDWVYTRDRIVNYTNVPGGDYIFHYKASSDPNTWKTEEKTLHVHVATVFYKTLWFKILLGFVLLWALFAYYRSRLRHKERVMRLENKAQLLEKEKTQVMYETLRQQLNPHFLFNSLTSLASLINVNPKAAGKFLDSLSKTYRYILKSSNNDTVPLINEIKFAESYISLQQTRFEKGLIVNVKVDEEYDHRLIVPVTLQNLIENAIKHNIIDSDSPLVIDIYTEDEKIVIRNNLQRKNFVETSNRQGLKNLQSLYHFLSNRKLEIQEDANYFLVKIPLL